MDYIVHKAVELDALSAKTVARLDNRAWLVSPKYDGCHAVFLFDNGKFVRAVSRTQEPIRSMDHIGHALEITYKDVLWPGRRAIAGEAWSWGMDFNVISGMFRRHTPAPLLGFVPFDFLSWDYKEAATVDLYSIHAYAKRIEALQVTATVDLVYSVDAPIKVRGPLSYVMKEAEAAAKFYKACTIAAYDGVIVAQADGMYIPGAGKGGEFIKCKPLLSFTVTVTGQELAVGDKTGKNTAALVFQLDGKEQKVSTGLTQLQVEDIHKNGWAGYRIEVGAMGKTVNGFLREPRFSGIRVDA